MKGACFHVTVLSELRDKKINVSGFLPETVGGGGGGGEGRCEFFVSFCDLNNLMKRVMNE